MKKIKIRKGFIVQKTGDKLTIFDAEESVLHSFNESASFIFAKIKLGWEKGKIVQLLAKKYKIKAEKAEKDIRNLISDLKKKKIIAVSS